MSAKNGHCIPPSPEKSEHSKTINKVLTNRLLYLNVGCSIFAVFGGSHNPSLPTNQRIFIGQLIFKSACIYSVPFAGRRNSKRVMGKLRHHGDFRVFNKLKNQLIEQILEYCVKSEPTVDFSEIYSKPFGKPCKHWKFLTKKLTQFH